MNTGANKPCTAADLEKAIGPEVLETLRRKQDVADDILTGFVVNFPTPWTSTRRKAVCRADGDLSRA